MTRSGYTPLAGVDVYILDYNDLALMATAWVRQLGQQPEGVEHHHARKVILSLTRQLDDAHLIALIEAAPVAAMWNGFAGALETELERRAVVSAGPSVTVSEQQQFGSIGTM